MLSVYVAVSKSTSKAHVTHSLPFRLSPCAVLLFLDGSASARFTAVRIGSGGAQGMGTGPYDAGGGFVEEYMLEDFELSPADLGE